MCLFLLLLLLHFELRSVFKTNLKDLNLWVFLSRFNLVWFKFWFLVSFQVTTKRQIAPNLLLCLAGGWRATFLLLYRFDNLMFAGARGLFAFISLKASAQNNSNQISTNQNKRKETKSHLRIWFLFHFLLLLILQLQTVCKWLN